jgi:hypothetical protein
MAIKVSLDDIIAETQPEILEILKKDFRKELDTRTTILDLSYDALKVNVYRNTKQHLEAYNIAYKILVEAVNRIAKRKYSKIEDLPPGYFSNKNSGYVYINGGDSNRFVIANSFGAIDTFVREVSRDKEVSKTSFGISTIFKQKKDSKGRPLPDEFTKEYRRKSDIGHISSEDSENLTSPLEEKIQSLLRLGSEIGNNKVVLAAESALKDLYSIQVDAAYTFKNTTPEAIAAARSKLGSGYVVVTLHRQKLNNKFSQQEAAIFFKLKQAIAKAVASKPYELISGSNNIVQDISQHLLHVLNKKQTKAPNKHNGSKKVTTPKAGIIAKSKTTSVTKQVKLSNVVGTSMLSLTSLQNLINRQLQDVVSANMGDGNSRSVLNYRTGRLASSAKVEYMSESRAGMITAFYSYMKNPYATFSDGGKQQNPKSRDPKLLISKSIREIAQQQVGNRLRAVNI